MSPLSEFSVATQLEALTRQGHVCANCGAAIGGLAAHGAATAYSANGGHAHALSPLSRGGSRAVKNCVVLCASCDLDELEGDAFESDAAIGRRASFPHYEKGASKIKPARASK